MSHLASAGMEQLILDFPQGKLTNATECGAPYSRRMARLCDLHAYNACRIAAADYNGWGSQGLAEESRRWARYVWIMPGSDGFVRIMGMSQGVFAIFEVEGELEGFGDGRWLAIPREWTPGDTHLVHYALVADGEELRAYAGDSGAFGNSGTPPAFIDGECVFGRLSSTVELDPPPQNPPIGKLLAGDELATTAHFSEEDAKRGAWCDLATIGRALAVYQAWMVDNLPVGYPYTQGGVRQTMRLRISGDGFLEMVMTKGLSRGLVLVSADKRIYDSKLALESLRRI